MEVWFAFHAKALVYPELRRLSANIQDGLHKASRFVLEEIIRNRLARPDLNIELETEKLYALIDGLAMHKIMQPDRLPVERLESLLESFLAGLCA